MTYYESIDFREIGKDVFLVDTGSGKYLLDNVTASIARLSDKVDIKNEQHATAIYEQLDPNRETKRVFRPTEYIENKKLCRLMLYLTVGCNMRCIYCHCDSTIGENMTDDAMYLTIDKYVEHMKNRIDSIREYEETPQITFMGGGEPFLRISKIREVTEYFNQKCEELGLKPRYVLVTNTTLGTDEDWKWLVDNEFWLNLSLDGPPEIQNRNRPLANQVQSAGLTESRLRFLSEIGADCHVRSTVIDVEDVDVVCNYFKQFSCVKTHALEPVSLAGRAIKSNLGVKKESFYRLFFREYSKFLLEEPDRFKSSWFRPFKRTEGFCGAVYCNAIVLPNGDISLCSEVSSDEPNKEIREKFIVSSIYDNDDVFESKAATSFAYENSIDTLSMCVHCPIKYKCGGGCYIRKIRDFKDTPELFYDEFCRSAIDLNLSFMINCLDMRNEHV